MTETSSLDGARAHARSLVDAAAGSVRTIPSTAATELPPGVVAADVIWDERIEIGNYASHVLPRGTVVRIADLDGDACVQLLAYNAATTAERLNVIDTVKVQWQAYLDAGALLLSDMGRVLMTIVADTSARHDCLCGCSTRCTNAARYGDGLVSGPTPSGRDLLSLAGAKHGLERRDIAPNVTLFKGVRVTDDGALHLDGGPTAFTYVELRVELDLIVLLANTPHPLDDRDTYAGTAARVTAWRPTPATLDDPFRAATPERLRAFQNTDELVRAERAVTIVYDEVVPARVPWAHVVPMGHALRITDLGGNQAVDCLVYDAHDHTHRYSAADTITAQRNIFLVEGTQLLSNEGEAMMTITATSCAYHDTIGGACSRESNTLRYGHHTASQHACVDNFLDAGTRHGLSKRDLVSNINWFINVPIGTDGTLGIVDGISAPGLTVDLRAEIDVLVLISNCPQINNPCNGFDPTPIRLQIFDGPCP